MGSSGESSIYNPDGTPNLQTAERLGWGKIRAEREEAARKERRAAEKARPIAGP